MIKAKIIVTHASSKGARAVAASVSPDNPKTRPRIITQVHGCRTQTTIEGVSGVESLMVTLNDLLSCVQAAERTLASIPWKAR